MKPTTFLLSQLLIASSQRQCLNKERKEDTSTQRFFFSFLPTSHFNSAPSAYRPSLGAGSSRWWWSS
jgi:hypothetical protein